MIGPATNFIARLPRPVVTALLMVGVTLSTTTMHTIIRMVTQELHPFEVAFFRNFFGLMVLVPLFLRGGIHMPHTRRIPLHLLRTAFQLVSMTSFFFGLSMVPLAKASALTFT